MSCFRMLSTRTILQSQRASIVGGAAAATVLAAGGTYAYLSTRAASRATDAPKAFSSGFNFVSLRLHSVESVNDNTKRLRFELPNEKATSGLGLVSAMLMVARPEGAWFPTVRPYTPVGDLDEPGFIEFMVKHYPNGKGSTHLHSLSPGQSVSFAGPIPGYSYVANQHPRVVLIAGGAGITPMHQLIRGILKNPEDKTKITLVWGVNRDSDIFFEEEFTRLQKEHPGRFEVHYTVSNPKDGSKFQKGYITKQVLEQASLAPYDKDTKVFVCGPPAMEAAVVGGRGPRGGSGILSELGYSRKQVHKF